MRDGPESDSYQNVIDVAFRKALWKFDDRHHDLINQYGISVSQMRTDMFHLS